MAEATIVRTNIPIAPTYTLTASDVVCSGHMVKVFDSNDGSYNPGLSTASEADECAEACRTRSQPSSTSLYQWGTAISDGSWMKRTVGSPEDGECHCTFEDTNCVPYTDTFPFYDRYTFVKTESICRAETFGEVNGNYVRSDCSCEYGFAGDLCQDPRMSCILDGKETPNGESCDCFDFRLNNTGGCCPLGTIFAATKYLSFTPFQAFAPMDDSNYYRNALYDICHPHEGISQNESSSPQLKVQSVFNYITDASEIRVIGPADDCKNAPSVDFLYDYEYSMEGYCGDGVTVYNEHGNPGVSKEDKQRYCFEACMGKYPPVSGAYTSLLIHGFTIFENGECRCNYNEQMLPKLECSSFTNAAKTYRIISAPMGCLEVDAIGMNRVINVGKSHIFTWDTKPRPMVQGSHYENQLSTQYPLHTWNKKKKEKETWYFAHLGECKYGDERRQYAGCGNTDGPNILPGGKHICDASVEERRDQCAIKCIINYPSYPGFVVTTTGRCYCEHAPPGCETQSPNDYTRYEFIPKSELSTTFVKKFDEECTNGDHYRVYAGCWNSDAPNTYPDGTTVCDATSEKRIDECGKRCLQLYPTLPGFIVHPNGRCYCQTADSATCSRASSDYDRYDHMFFKVETSITLINQINTVHCNKDFFESYSDWVRCAARSCQGLTRGGYSMKRMIIGTKTEGDIVKGEVICFPDNQGRYGLNEPKTAKQITEPWNFNFPNMNCQGHIVQVAVAKNDNLSCMQSCIDGTPTGNYDSVWNNLNFFDEGRVTKYFAFNKDTGRCLCYDYVPNKDAPDDCIDDRLSWT